MQVKIRSAWRRAPTLLALAFAGCASSAPVVNPQTLLTTAPATAHVDSADRGVIRASDNSCSALPEGPLSLAQLVAAAVDRHPELTVASAKAAVARGKLVQAGLYPNPVVGWEGDDMGHPEHGAGKQGPTFEQEIVTSGKLELARAAASHGVAAADWQAITRRFELITRVRIAYYDVLAADRELRENEELTAISERGLRVAETLARTIGNQTDVLRARIALEQSKISLSTAQRRAETAWRTLATLLGEPDLPRRLLAGSLDAPPPLYTWEPVRAAVLTRSSAVLEAQALILVAESELGRAHAEVCSNVHLGVHPFYAFPDKRTEWQVSAAVALPLFDRNQGNILAAQAAVAQAFAEARSVELKLTDRLTQAFQRYEIARAQVEAYTRPKDGILDSAKEWLRLITLAFEKGDPKFDINSFLDAQHNVIQARLSYTQAQAELWRAAVEIMGLLQEEK